MAGQRRHMLIEVGYDMRMMADAKSGRGQACHGGHPQSLRLGGIRGAPGSAAKRLAPPEPAGRMAEHHGVHQPASGHERSR